MKLKSRRDTFIIRFDPVGVELWSEFTYFLFRAIDHKVVNSKLNQKEVKKENYYEAIKQYTVEKKNTCEERNIYSQFNTL